MCRERKMLALVSPPPFLCFFSRWHFHLPLPSFPIFSLNAPLEPMSQLFHGLAEGYALLSNLYSTHACISILFRVSVHYRPNDISLQLRTKVERKRRERLFAWSTHCVPFFIVNGEEMDREDPHVHKYMNKILSTLIHIHWALQHCLFKYFHILLIWSLQ